MFIEQNNKRRASVVCDHELLSYQSSCRPFYFLLSIYLLMHARCSKQATTSSDHANLRIGFFTPY